MKRGLISVARQVLRLDERTGVSMIPNVRTRGRQSGTPYLMRTNAEGFRTRSIRPKPEVGTKRVLFYGDSFTEGVGVSDGHRFTDLLEDMIPNAEVLNFGVRATGTDQQLLLFRQRPTDLEYDLVVVGLYTGDVHRNSTKYGVMTSPTGEHYQKPFFRLEQGQLALHNVPVPLKPTAFDRLPRSERELVYFSGVGYRLRMMIRRYAPSAKTTLQRLTRYQPAPYLSSADDPAWLLTRAIVQQWSLEASAPVLVLAIPPYQYVERTANSFAYRTRFAELGEADGITVHDPLDDLIGAEEGGPRGSVRLPGDEHYSAKGHQVIAESLAPRIAALLGSTDSAIQGVQR